MIYISGYALTHGGKGSGNYFIDENDVSLYINMWLPFCYFLLFIENKRIIRILFITGLILGNIGSGVFRVAGRVCWIDSGRTP